VRLAAEPWKPAAAYQTCTCMFCALEPSGLMMRPVTVPRPMNVKSRVATCPFDSMTRSSASSGVVRARSRLPAS
jgi:hypothetical protein